MRLKFTETRVPWRKDFTVWKLIRGMLIVDVDSPSGNGTFPAFNWNNDIIKPKF